MSDTAKGICWALMAAACFAVVAAMAKVVVTQYHVLQILFLRQLVVLLSSLPSILPQFPGSLRTQRPALHALRLAGAFAALFFSVIAVAHLPLTTVITLAFAQVFFATLFAGVFLKENVGRQRIAAVVVGFCGALIVMRPGVEGFLDVWALVALLGAAGAAVAVTTIKILSRTETTGTIVSYQALGIGTIAGISMFWCWQTPDTVGLALMLGMGVFAALGQWVGVHALRLTDVSVLSNVEYSKLIYAAILGYVLFDEVPDLYTLVGAGVIIGSSMYIFQRESVRNLNR